MNVELEAAVRRLRAVQGGGLVALPDENAAALEADIAAVLDALSAPPADDVREALAAEAWAAYQLEHGYSTVGVVPDVGADFWAGFERGYEVRPRGTVTDAAQPVELYYCPEHGDLLPRGSAETRSLRCAESHSVEQIRSSLSSRGTVTDAEVERAAREYHERGNGTGSFERVADHVKVSLLFRMRAALEAAREDRS